MVDVEHGSRIVSFHGEPVAATASGIRRELRVAFPAWGLDDDAVDDALLVVEEMVANVVDHARTPFRLVVGLDRAVLRIAVHDRCPRPVRAQELDLGRRRGRGLLMIDNISARWGSDTDADGKTVWAELAV